MTLISDGLSILAASQLLLFLVMLLLSNNPIRVRLTGFFLITGIIFYLAIPVSEWHLQIQVNHWLWFFPAITPSMLLLFVWFVFEEQECAVPPWMLIVIISSISLSVYYAAIEVGLPGAPLGVQTYKLLIIGMALYVVNRGTHTDLVEERFRARRLFIGALAAVMLITVGIEIFADFNTAGIVALVQKSVIFIFALSFNVHLLRLNPKVQLLGDPVTVKKETDDPVIDELLKKMQGERLYADHDLRVGGLAELMGMPEYQLRKKINQQLGYRNFNQFVNQYRIEEAGVQLLANQRMPVLSIALDVGFRSISSFNTAFQSQFGVSPTKYRADGLEKQQTQSEGDSIEQDSTSVIVPS